MTRSYPMTRSNLLRPGAVAVLLVIFFVAGCTGEQNMDDASATSTSMADMDDRAMLIETLELNAESFREMVSGLTPEQLAFQESPDRWSIAGVAEHIVATETIFEPMIQGILASGDDANAMPDSTLSDDRVVSVMADRSQKYQAPEVAQPTGKFSTAEDILAAFDAQRARTIEMVESSEIDLRTVYGDHPALGTLDGAQWILFVASHADRHIDQMQQVVDHSGFPAS